MTARFGLAKAASRSVDAFADSLEAEERQVLKELRRLTATENEAA
jgi:hypothetical protein